MADKSPVFLMNKGGVFYFTIHVPNDAEQHYERSRIVMYLKTTSEKMTPKAIDALARKLDDFWLQIRVF